MKAVIQTLLYAAPLAVALTLVQVKNAEAFKLFGQCFFGSCKKDDKAERFIDPKTYDVEFSVDELAPDDDENDNLQEMHDKRVHEDLRQPGMKT